MSKYNRHHMVTFMLRDTCRCGDADPMSLHFCPKQLDAEIHYIEELVTILIENPCMKMTRACALPD